MNAMLNFSSPVADGALRRCALTLHAIGAEDRAWVLSNLTGPSRTDLEQLIEELDALGFAPDAGLARSAVNDRPKTRVEREKPEERAQAGTNAWRQADAVMLARLLQDEPAALTARLLMTRSAPFREAVLFHLVEPERSQVKDAVLVLERMTHRNDAPRLFEAVEAQVTLRLSSAKHLQPRIPRHSIAQRWRSGWRRLGEMLS
jgi:hypothetical protein